MFTGHLSIPDGPIFVIQHPIRHHSPPIHAPQSHGHIVGTKECLKPSQMIEVSITAQKRSACPWMEEKPCCHAEKIRCSI